MAHGKRILAQSEPGNRLNAGRGGHNPAKKKEDKTMFNRAKINGQTTRLYYHQTDGGAEYLTDAFVVCPTGERCGIFDGATLIIRIDGGELEIITPIKEPTA
jgi:hypothetical protein